MKELSIEEKARRYDEAIERAKKVLLDCTSEEQKVVEYITPELKESEDEIRKAVIDAVETLSDSPLKVKMLAWLEKQGEQKPVDKFEPKFNFKVGQWIVATGKCVYLITKIDRFNVTLVDTNGDEYVFDVSSLDDAYQWTIQDAKDGDVLALNGEVFIYAHRKQMYSIAVAHCFVDEVDVFHFDGEFGYTEKGNSIHPATKEQRELLFQKMKEAGYIWDAERKELKKVEQKPAWSEEDEVKINRIVGCLENLNVADNDILLKDVDWLKSLRPQNRWKPSDEQMVALKHAFNDGSIDFDDMKILGTLYEQLKALHRYEQDT